MRLSGLVTAAAWLVSACGPDLGRPAVSPPSPGAEPSVRTSPGPVTSPTSAPTLPGGFEPRPGRPALVNGEAAACVPSCGLGRVEGGALPKGRYQTEWFFGGYMTVETDGRWERGEDSSGELGMYLPPERDYGLKFHLDLYPVKDEQRVHGIPSTAAGLVDWLRSQEWLVVGEGMSTRIGPLPANGVDVRLSASAPQQFADCGAPCVDFLGFEQFDHAAIGIHGDDLYRIYFADVQYDGSAHVLVAHVESRARVHLDSVLPAVEQVLASVTVPAAIPH